MLFSAVCQGQEYFKIWVDYDSTGLIGDAMKLQLHCESRHPEEVTFPFLQGQISEDLQLIPRDSLQTDTSYNPVTRTKTKTVTYLFSAYREGTYTLPSFCFEVPQRDSNLVYCTDTALVRIFAPEVDTTAAIKDINTIFEVSRKELVKEYWAKYDIILWIALAVAALVAAIFYIRKKWKRKEPLFVPKKVVVPPIDKALLALKTLKGKQLWQNNQIKEYYTELTDILRTYLSEALGIPAIEMTNEELRAALQEHFPPKSREAQDLIEVLDRATLVKFAKVFPSPDEHESSFSRIQTFLDEQKAEQQKSMAEAEAKKKAQAAANPDKGSDNSKGKETADAEPGDKESSTNGNNPSGENRVEKGIEKQENEEKEAPVKD